MPEENTELKATETKKEKIVLTDEQFNGLMNRLNALENQKGEARGTSPDGRTLGIVEKHSIEVSDYPNPTEKLYDEPALKRFALRDNYLLKFEIKGITYETKWGATIREPVFTVTLFRKQFDAEGKLANKLIKVQKQVLTEDEFFAKQVASQMGLDLSEMTLKELMDRMRYERIKRWLLSLFIPSQNAKPVRKEHQTVIDGKPVTMVETEDIL